MSDDNSSNRPRRSSLTSSAFSAIFGPRNNTSNGSTTNPPSRTNGTTTNGTSSTNGTSTTPPHPAPNSRRRMSISTLGLSGSPITINPPPSFFPRDRRASTASTISSVSSSIPSSSISESAIEDDSPDTTHSVPTTPFTRHMSFGGSSTLFPRSNTISSSNNNGGTNGTSTSPQKSRSPSDSPGLNWSEQFRERAASAVHRPPQMGGSPPAAAAAHVMTPHVRARSEGGGDAVQAQTQVQAQAQAAAAAAVRRERRKPDEVGERMLRGEFYMD